MYSKVKLSNLNLDDHAKKKLIKLVGERYCKDTDKLTITTDRYGCRKEKNAISSGCSKESIVSLLGISVNFNVFATCVSVFFFSFPGLKYIFRCTNTPIHVLKM